MTKYNLAAAAPNIVNNNKAKAQYSNAKNITSTIMSTNKKPDHTTVNNDKSSKGKEKNVNNKSH